MRMRRWKVWEARFGVKGLEVCVPMLRWLVSWETFSVDRRSKFCASVLDCMVLGKVKFLPRL